MGLTSREIADAVDGSRALTHRWRAMRTTLECGHIRLIPEINTIMGIGAFTGCMICPLGDDGYHVTRQVVNVEETGVLHDSWVKERTKSKEKNDGQPFRGNSRRPD